MEKYLTKFNTIDEYNAFKNGTDIPYVNVSYIAENDSIEYYRNSISMQPFTIKIVSIPQDATCVGLHFRTSSCDEQNSKIKINNGEWQNISQYGSWDNYMVPDLVVGDKVQCIIKGSSFNDFGLYKNNESENQNTDESNIDTAGNEVNIYGNILSTVCGDEYRLGLLPNGWGANAMFGDGEFCYLRYILIDASDLWLPTNQLKDDCFRYLFTDLYGLTAAPNIYAKALPNSSCFCMFQGCKRLTSMPQIYTEIAESDNTFYNMFNGCTSLVQTTPLRIKSTDSYSDTCQGMFQNCTSLTSTPQWDSYADLVNHSNTNGTLANMFKGCTSLTTINFDFGPISNPYNNWCNYMFQDCTSLTEVTIHSYNNGSTGEPVFQGCTSLSTIYYEPNTSMPFGEIASTGTLYYKEYADMQYNPADLVPSEWTVTPWIQN